MSVATAVRRVANSAMVAGALLASSAVVAHAQPSTNPFLGNGGDVSVRFIGSSANDISQLFYKVGNGAYNNGAYTLLFTNGVAGDLAGTQKNIGVVAAGTEVFFRLVNTTQGFTFYSGDAGRNTDNLAHVSLGAGSGTAVTVPGHTGTYAQAFNFEDRSNPPITSTDYDYNDLNFEIANAVATVPEPSSVALMGFGILGLGVAARRRRRV